jgi:DNA-binding response OmpR family regulator
MRTEVAQRRIEAFRKRFGEAHLYLAYHAAFPLALTPDLLYRLWANFQRDIHGEILNIPWIAVADLLLSSLCDEVGDELYEMEKEVRNALLSELNANPRFSTERINKLSDFLLAYIRQQLDSPDLDTRDFAQAQKWTALAYVRPTKAAHEIALTLSRLELKEKTEWLRMASLVETFAEPLAGFEPLLIYSRGMANFARGDLESATDQLGKLFVLKGQVEIAGVGLGIPPEVRKPESDLTGKKILVIEDEEFLRQNILKLLDFEGFDVIGAENGHVGLQLARELNPNLVISDMIMPKFDGSAVLTALRQDFLTATIPFIFLTTKATKADFRKGMELGADDCLTKPYTRKELLGAIVAQLKKRERLISLGIRSEARKPESDLVKERILVIEDDEQVRNNILDLLEEQGFNVIDAENGWIGLQLARQMNPNLIVSDIVMPELNGYQLLTALRQEPLTATIPFIFLTAKAAKADFRKGMELGADDYLTLPFVIGELLRAIDTQLEKRARLVREISVRVPQRDPV